MNLTNPVVAIVSPGEMGSAIARGLSAHGIATLTSSDGRSARSLERARASGMQLVDGDGALVAQADIVLSVVPPDQALALAARLAPALQRKAGIVFVDCNAIAPDTVHEIARRLGGGPRFVDASLFGGPTSGKPGVVLYASGPHAAALAPLDGRGLAVRAMSGPVGAASALKMCFAGINKGMTGLGALMLGAAQRAGCADEVAALLADTQPALLAYLSRFVPAMFPKAGRWAPEMNEIAGFLGDEPGGAAVFGGLSDVFEHLGADVAAQAGRIAALEQFCRAAAPKKAAD